MKKKAAAKPARAGAKSTKRTSSLRDAGAIPPPGSQKVMPLPDKRPMRAPRRPAAARLEPQKVHARQKRKGS